MSHIKINSDRAEKRIKLLISYIEDYENRLKVVTSEQDKKWLRDIIDANNEAIVAIIRNLI